MTSNRLVTLLRELTANQYSDNVLLMWLSNCENTVLTDVLLASPEDCVELTELSDEKLIVPHPWDKLYLPYMQAQVAHANGEYDHYGNYIALFNAYLEEYARHILETVQPAGGEAVTHGYYLSAYAIAVEHGYKGTVEQWLKSLIGPQGDGGKDAYTIAVEQGFTGTVEQWLASMKGDAATVEIVGADALAAVDEPTVTEVEGSTPAARKYKLGIPAGQRGIPGEAGRLAIVGADALTPGAAPTVTEMAGSTAQNRLYKLGIPQGQKGNKGDKGDTGGTSLPIARANVPAGTDDVYTATGDLLPVVSVANNPEQISAVGKGLQIVFIPMIANKTESPKLRLNGGEAIPIRMRWYTNKGTNESAPEATTNVEVGSLMRGVPYTLTFCGKYWLVDSQITSPSFDNTTRGTLQSVANGFIGASGGNNFAVPINYQNGVIRNAMISTTEAEKESNSINLVSEGKASEMIRKDVTAEWVAYYAENPNGGPKEFAVTLGAGRYFFSDVESFRAYATVVEGSFNAGETKLTFLTTLYDDFIHYMQIFANGTLIYETELDAGGKSSDTWLYQSGIAERVITSGKYPPPTRADNGKFLGCENGAATWKTADELKGADGKSAYQYAKDGGYTGTEAEFAEKLAQEMLSGTTGELTPTQVYDAVSAGIPVKVQYTDPTFGLISFTAFNVSESLNAIASQIIAYYNGVCILAELDGDKSDNTWGFHIITLAQKTDIPSALPNPNALTFTGAVTGSYDGSVPLTVEIPRGDSIVPAPSSADNGKYLGCENGAAKWLPVEASGGGDKWELINEFTIPEGAEESNSLSLTKDSNGNDFVLKKALLLSHFPPYTGESTIPNFSFASINGIMSGSSALVPNAYTSAWPTLSKTSDRGGAYFVDVSGIFQIEKALKTDTSKLKSNGIRVFTNINSQNNIDKEWMAIPNVIGTIREIGGTAMLIYPGCWFALYGVRA